MNVISPLSTTSSYVEEKKAAPNMQVSSSAFPCLPALPSSNLSVQAVNSVVKAKKKKKKKKKNKSPNLSAVNELFKTDQDSVKSLQNDIPAEIQKIRNNFFKIASTLTSTEVDLFKNLFTHCHTDSPYSILDLFKLDFISYWNDVKANNHLDQEIFKQLHEIFFNAFYKFDLILSRDLYCKDKFNDPLPEFFVTHDNFLVFLTGYCSNLTLMKNEIQTKINSSLGEKSNQAKLLSKNKDVAIIKSLDCLIVKIDLLKKLLKFPNEAIWGVHQGIIRSEDVGQKEVIDTVFMFSSFLKESLSSNIIGFEIDPFIKPLHELIIQMKEKGVNKKLALQFNNAFKTFSYHSSTLNLKFQLAYKNAADPNITHEQDYKLGGNQSLHKHNGNKFRESLLHRMRFCLMFDRWINQLHDDLNNHFIICFGENSFKIPYHYKLRFFTNFKDMLTLESLPAKKYEFELLNVLANKIINWLTLPQKYMYSSFDPKSNEQLMTLFNVLKEDFSGQPISFSILQLAISSYSDSSRPMVDRIIFQIQTIHKLYLQEIRKAHKEGLISSKEKFKEQIQEIIFYNMVNLCRFLMVNQDALAFNKDGHNHDDIIHLLPSPVIDFLLLKGFDEIFTPILTINAPVVIESVIQDGKGNQSDVVKPIEVKDFRPSSQIAKPSSQLGKPSKKEVVAPTKQDFLEVTKRNAIIRMLELMGFKIKRTGKGSHVIYENEMTGNHAVVPQHVDKIGTRLNIFEQATTELKQSKDST